MPPQHLVSNCSFKNTWASSRMYGEVIRMRVEAVESNAECILYHFRHICYVVMCALLSYLAAWDPPRPGKAARLPPQHLVSSFSSQNIWLRCMDVC
jgi:hypothetical protein